MARMAQPQFTVSVAVRPLPEHTDAAQQLYGYAYTVTIRNSGSTTAQLIARRWRITDHRGTVQAVNGLAVVGHQPLLKPGEQFEYTSWAQIATPQGSMQGTFVCITEDTDWFEVPVPEFALADTAALH
ncbi:MAG: Co2+/Mg2+ efflux protein ApaG [Burkholderiales bacterium PBB5]|nr:MAG: Co2+/Mg2+ efflux protein ApaG [Burkholderiales bacterium PBB5]